MNGETSKVAALLRRECWELRSPRVLAALGLLAGMQCLVMAASRQTGRVEDTSVLFMLGGLVGVALAFDLVAKEREHRALDLLLTQGVSRRALFAAKWLAALGLCGAAALAATAGSLVGRILSGKPAGWSDLAAEFTMLWWLLAVFGLLALLCSVALRRGKWALMAAAVAWAILRPPVMMLLVLAPLQDALGWDQTQLWRVLAVLPEFAFRLGLDLPRGAPDTVSIEAWLPYAALAAYVAVFTAAAAAVFVRQDEPSV